MFELINCNDFAQCTQAARQMHANLSQLNAIKCVYFFDAIAPPHSAPRTSPTPAPFACDAAFNISAAAGSWLGLFIWSSLAAATMRLCNIVQILFNTWINKFQLCGWAQMCPWLWLAMRVSVRAGGSVRKCRRAKSH